jgi:hypothetical protein
VGIYLIALLLLVSGVAVATYALLKSGGTSFDDGGFLLSITGIVFGGVVAIVGFIWLLLI